LPKVSRCRFGPLTWALPPRAAPIVPVRSTRKSQIPGPTWKPAAQPDALTGLARPGDNAGQRPRKVHDYKRHGPHHIVCFAALRTIRKPGTGSSGKGPSGRHRGPRKFSRQGFLDERSKGPAVPGRISGTVSISSMGQITANPTRDARLESRKLAGPKVGPRADGQRGNTERPKPSLHPWAQPVSVETASSLPAQSPSAKISGAGI